METINRILPDWIVRIESGSLVLPRFQRGEAWDKGRIKSLFDSIINNLPSGITLILQIGNEEPFKSRPIITAPDTRNRATEHLLDGQQRLTAIYRILKNNYDDEKYFVYFSEFDKQNYGKDFDDESTICVARYLKRGNLYPMWCDNPNECLSRGLIPTDLFNPSNFNNHVSNWLDSAIIEGNGLVSAIEELILYKYRTEVERRINHIILTISKYNLPILSLGTDTKKEIALDVFIKMNTNSKPLSHYDIIVAEIESIRNISLHDYLEDLKNKIPRIEKLNNVEDLVLNTSALIQDKLPNQMGVWSMDKSLMIDNWDKMITGLEQMVKLLQEEGVYDRDRLPTNAILAPLAALFTFVEPHGDKRGRDVKILRQYLWRSFFTDRYENSAPTRAYKDYINLKKVLGNLEMESGGRISFSDVPIFSEHNVVDKDELITAPWPKRTSIKARGILAIANRSGARDFQTDEKISKDNIESRHYHHIFPKSLLEEASIENKDVALNCALIDDKSNMSIGRKEPLQYLRERYDWSNQEEVNRRLLSHIIPIDELANGGYEGLSAEEQKEKVISDYNKFIEKRADMILSAVNELLK